MNPKLTLAQLAALIPGAQLHSLNNPVIQRVDYDSRQVESGSLFVAIRGEKTDGHQFVAQAFSQGAAAVAVRVLPVEGADRPCLIVPDSRKALAIIAGALADHPDRDMTLVGITGTNGKTTTACLVMEILLKACGPSGLISTVGTRVGATWQPTRHTTPEAPDLYALLLQMKQAGCWSVVLEVSSHALELDRTFGLKFTTTVFTNLSQDHLDFHGDMESYYRAKARLFQEYSATTAVINIDDSYGKRLMESSQTPVLTYSLTDPADVRVERYKLSPQGIFLTAETPRGKVEFHSPLIGKFNAYNLLCGLAISESLGITLDVFVSCAEAFRGAPGRLERFDWGKRQIYVDYAHTPDALEKVLIELKGLKHGPVSVVFGCGGNRDRGKRPLMGRTAEQIADRVYVTSDNPRNEGAEEIIKEILEGLNHPQKAQVNTDRREAIQTALQDLPKKAVLLIAGKGHEDYQEIRGVRYPFDDREEVRRFLEAQS